MLFIEIKRFATLAGEEKRDNVNGSSEEKVMHSDPDRATDCNAEEQIDDAYDEG